MMTSGAAFRYFSRDNDQAQGKPFNENSLGLFVFSSIIFINSSCEMVFTPKVFVFRSFEPEFSPPRNTCRYESQATHNRLRPLVSSDTLAVNIMASSAGEMKSAYHFFIGRTVVKKLYGLLGLFDMDRDAVGYKEVHGPFRHVHETLISGSNNKDVRLYREDILQVCLLEDMALLSPPGWIDPVGIDDDIRSIGLPVNNDLAETVMVDVHEFIPPLCGPGLCPFRGPEPFFDQS
jgi:hypothetical protein